MHSSPSPEHKPGQDPPIDEVGVRPALVWEQVCRGEARLIDVRTPDEFRRLHARRALNVPLDELTPAVLEGGPVYLICRGGDRSRQAWDKLRQGTLITPVQVVAGGTLAWKEAGLPVLAGRRPRKRVSWLKVAGIATVIVSFLLAIFVHKGLLGIAGLVGACTAAVMMLHPRHWRTADERRVTAESPD